MAISDVSWGSVVVGAAITTAIVALSITNPPLALVAKEIGVAATLIGSMVVGGIAGEFVHDLLSRAGDAASTFVKR